MAEIYKVNIVLTGEGEKILSIPQEISVPKYSIVQWNIAINPKSFRHTRFSSKGLIFTIYFEEETPFPWRRQFAQLPGDPFYDTESVIIRLAEEVAEVKGEYKYGVSVAEAEKGEIIYDEDPILTVY